MRSVWFDPVAAAGVGRVTRSRWAMGVAPAVFVLGFELTRQGTDSVTVDAIHLGSLYGLIAFVVVRGFHAVVALAPMVLAAALFARPLSAAPVALATVGLLVLGVALARPPSTDPVRWAHFEPLEGSIAELGTVDLDGHPLAVTIRGDSVDDPALLYRAELAHEWFDDTVLAESWTTPGHARVVE